MSSRAVHRERVLTDVFSENQIGRGMAYTTLIVLLDCTLDNLILPSIRLILLWLTMELAGLDLSSFDPSSCHVPQTLRPFHGFPNHTSTTASGPG